VLGSFTEEEEFSDRLLVRITSTTLNVYLSVWQLLRELRKFLKARKWSDFAIRVFLINQPITIIINTPSSIMPLTVFQSKKTAKIGSVNRL
jgi:hypothetical protein